MLSLVQAELIQFCELLQRQRVAKQTAKFTVRCLNNFLQLFLGILGSLVKDCCGHLLPARDFNLGANVSESFPELYVVPS